MDDWRWRLSEGNYIDDSLFVSGTKGKRLTYKGLIQ